MFDNNVDSEFPSDWEKVDIIRVSNCYELEIRLSYSQSFVNELENVIFIVENISKLKIPQFEVGVPSTNIDDTEVGVSSFNKSVFQIIILSKNLKL